MNHYFITSKHSIKTTSLFSRAWRSSVVFPAPKKPESKVIGTFFT